VTLRVLLGRAGDSLAVAHLAVALCALLALSSCATSARAAREGASPRARPSQAYPSVRFVVLSDPHVYDGPGDLPAAAAAADRTGLLAGMSPVLLREAVARAIELRPDFVLIPGDLTKDGELSSHERALSELSRLSAAGVRAFVVPGNHDVENPRAAGYSNGKAVRLPSPTASRFAELYSAYGYGDASSRDRLSLSYVARLAPGLRLLALDPFRRPLRPDPQSPEPEGAIAGATMSWIRKELDEAERSGDAVIAMSHLSLVEHFEGQAKFFPASLPRGRVELCSLLAEKGVKLAFTGHFHFQDVTRYQCTNGGELYDIGTGSLAYYPMPYRLVELKSDSGGAKAAIRGYRLTESSDASADSPRQLLANWLTAVLEPRLKRVLVPRDEAELIAASYARAYLALVSGDERPAPGEDELPAGIDSPAGRLAKKQLAPLLKSLWNDLPPADNDVEIELARSGVK
jgi:hypothetical protein